jgi:hypothetical protein
MSARRWLAVAAMLSVAVGAEIAQAQKKEMGEPLQRRDLAKLLPDRVFLEGEAPMVQKRNAVGARMEDGKLILVMLLDTSGYSSEYQDKYVGMLITQGTIYLNAKTLGPGAYGFGRRKSGGEKFVFYDLGGNPVAEVSAEKHDDLRPATPIQLREGKNRLRLYLGKFWIRISSRAGD